MRKTYKDSIRLRKMVRAQAKANYEKNKAKRRRQMKALYYKNQLAHQMYKLLITASGIGRIKNKRLTKNYRINLGHAKPMYDYLVRLMKKDGVYGPKPYPLRIKL